MSEGATAGTSKVKHSLRNTEFMDGPPGGSFWLRVGERFGVPVALCTVLLFAGWGSLSWTANNVLLPLTSRHIKFLDVSEETQKATVKAVEKVGDGIEEFKANQGETHSLIKSLVEEQKKTNSVLQNTRIKVSNNGTSMASGDAGARPDTRPDAPPMPTTPMPTELPQ